MRKVILMMLLAAVSSGVLTRAAIADSLSDAQSAYAAGDYAKALKLFKPLAQRGNAEAQVNIGTIYVLGEDVPQDYKEAMKWFRLAAEQGSVEAQSILGSMYAQGQGVAADSEEAAKWYQLAAEQGNSSAQEQLGILYCAGNSVPSDAEKAKKWFVLAAEQGSTYAQVTLGNMYEHGPYVHEEEPPKGDKKWIYWYIDNVVHFTCGNGIPQDYAEAAKWRKLAAEQGQSAAQFALALMYLDGLGVPQDYVLAHMWFDMASVNDTDETHRKVFNERADEVAGKMTSQQLAEVRELARECTAKKFKGCAVASSSPKVVTLNCVLTVQSAPDHRQYERVVSIDYANKAVNGYETEFNENEIRWTEKGGNHTVLNRLSGFIEERSGPIFLNGQFMSGGFIGSGHCATATKQF